MSALPLALVPETDDVTQIAAAMSRPEFYEDRPSNGVEVRETHGSWVFLVGSRAYKLKKAVVHPFLDYGTPARRRDMCRAEVELNRRLAPSVYLGVRSVVRRGGRWSLGPEAAMDAVEHIVEMARFDEATTLAAAVAGGRATPDDVRAVGRRLAAFHATAPSRFGPAEQLAEVRRSLAETLASLWSSAQRVGPDRIGAAERFAAAFLAGHSREIAARAEAGLVRDGHGDLRAEHVVMGPEGIEIVDRIEFDPRLRTLDVGADLAFLVMDLVRLGAETLSRELVQAYREAGGDPGPDRLIAFHAAHRAWVRAKVALLTPSAGDAKPVEDLMRIGERLAWRARLPLVIAVCGLPASGKSTVAQAIGERSGLPVVGSDATRKHLAGIPGTEPAGDDVYTPEFSRRTYGELGRIASVAAVTHGGAVIDATLRHRADRDALREGLAGASLPMVAVECRAPLGLRRARAADRAATGGAESDAGPDVVERLDVEWDPLDEILPHEHLIVRTDRPEEEVLADITALLDQRL